jgi:hypothetical protein
MPRKKHIKTYLPRKGMQQQYVPATKTKLIM